MKQKRSTKKAIFKELFQQKATGKSSSKKPSVEEKDLLRSLRAIQKLDMQFYLYSKKEDWSKVKKSIIGLSILTECNNKTIQNASLDTLKQSILPSISNQIETHPDEALILTLLLKHIIKDPKYQKQCQKIEKNCIKILMTSPRTITNSTVTTPKRLI